MKINNLRKGAIFYSVAVFAFFLLQLNSVYAYGHDGTHSWHGGSNSLYALPQGATKVNDQTTTNIDYVGHHTLDITAPNDAIINWNSFNIGLKSLVDFIQPSSSSVVLNRVTGIDPSLIYGTLEANGRVFIVDPNGIFFGPHSQVDVYALTASTLGISDSDFLAGNYNFTQTGKNARIINRGKIHVTNGGYVALLSDAINNSGVIIAPLGTVILATGQIATVVGLDDDGDISVTIDSAVANGVFGPNGKQITNAIENSGKIEADGGTILLTAKILNGIFDNAINNTGVIQANSLVNNNGTIELDAVGGNITTGTGSVISANGGVNGNGGDISIDSTNDISVDSGATLDISGGSQAGNGGSLDVYTPENVDFAGTILGSAATGYNPGTADLDPTNITWAGGTVSTDTTVDASGNITIIGSATVDSGITLNLFADTDSLTSGNWDAAGTGKILDTGGFTISGAAGGDGTLNLNAGGGIGTSANPVLVNGLGSVSILMDPSGSGPVFVSNTNSAGNAGTPFTIASASTTNSNLNLTSTNSAIDITGTINAGIGIVSLNGEGVSDASDTITANSLVLQGTGTFNLSDASNSVGTLAANVTGALTFDNSGALTVGTVSGTNGITTGKGNVLLDTTGALTISKAINAGSGEIELDAPGATGTVALTATDLILEGVGTFSLTSASNNIGTLVASITGPLTLTDSGALTIGSLSSLDAVTVTINGITTNNNSVTLNTGSTLTLNNNIDAGTTGATITLNPSAGGVTATSGGVIADNLVLTGKGVFNLTDLTDNAITTALAASLSGTGGSLTYGQSGALTVGDVGTTDGITSNNQNVLLNLSGLLTLNDVIKAGTGTVDLNAAGVAGSGGAVTAKNLILEGTGIFNFNNTGNHVTTALAADITGPLTYTDSGALTIGSLTSLDAVPTTISGITTNTGNLALITGGLLTLNNNITTVSGTVDLNSAGGVTATAGDVTAGTLILEGTGSFNLSNASNRTTADVVADITGALTYTDSGAVIVNSETSPTTAAVITGLTASSVTLTSAGLTLSNGINATGTVTLDSSSGVSAPSSAISAASLLLEGSGTFNLSDTSNAVNTLATNASSIALTFDDSNALTVGTVSGDNGINASSVTLNDVVNGIALNTNVNTGTGGQSYTGPVTLGAPTITLTGNDISFVGLSSTIDGGKNLVIDDSGTTVLGGAIGSNTSLISLNVTAATDIDIDGGTVNTTETQIYNGPVVLTGDTTLSGTKITFDSTLNDSTSGADTLDITGNAVFGGIVGTTLLNSLFVSGTTTMNSGATAVSTSTTQEYQGAVTLGASSTDLTGTTVTFDSTVNGGDSLTITGAASFNGVVGGTSELASLEVTGATTIDTSAIKTSGGQNYQAVTVDETTDLTASPGVSFDTTVNDANTGIDDLTITGNAAFDGEVGTSALGGLTVTGSTSINTTAINTSGAQDYQGAVTLDKGTDLTAGSTGVTFGGALNAFTPGGESLTITGDAIFDGAVGSVPLSSLSVSGSAAINGGSVASEGNQTYTGAVTLGGNSTLTGKGITFDSTIDGAKSLTISDSGTTTFGGAVGGTHPLTSLTTNAADINGGAVSTTGAQDYQGAVVLDNTTTLNGKNITFGSTLDGDFDLTINDTGTTIFGAGVGVTTAALSSLDVSAVGIDIGGSVMTSGDQTYNGPVSLTGTVTLTTTSAPDGITFDKTLNGAYGLTIFDSATTTFDGAVGGNAPLTGGLSVTAVGIDINGGSVNTGTGAQTYNYPVVLGGNATLTGKNISFDSTVDGPTSGSAKLTISDSGSTIFDEAVGFNDPLSSLTVTATGVSGIQIDGLTITTTGAQIYNDPVSLGAGTTLQGTTVTFGSTVTGDSNSLTIGSGSVVTNSVFDGGVSGLTTLYDYGTTAINGGSVASDGDQTYTGAVTLGANTTLTATTGNTVTFDSTVTGNSNSSLTIGASGTDLSSAVFGGAVSGLTTLNDYGATTINGGSITSSGTQTYTGTVALGAATTLTGSTVTFGSNLIGAWALGITGNAVFDGLVGHVSPLTSLSVSGTSAISTSAIDTSGTQTYTGTVTLDTTTDLTAGSTGVTFGSTVNDATAGTDTLTITGDAIFGGAVGGTPFNSLSVSGTTAINGGSVATSGVNGQTYTGAVTLGATTALTTNVNTVDFGSTVNGGGYNLTIGSGTDATNATFSGAVSNLGTLLVYGTSAINGGSIASDGNQTYTGAVTLGPVNTTLTTNGNIVDFVSTLTGSGHGLTIGSNSDATSVEFGGAVSGLSFLNIYGSSTLSGSITTSGAQDYKGAIFIGPSTVLTGNDITFEKTVDSTDVNSPSTSDFNTLTINDSGTTTFDGAVGGTYALGNLKDTATDGIDINGGSVNTTGNTQEYNGDVTIGANTTLTGTTITFDDLLDGAHNLTVNDATMVYYKEVGSNIPLSRLLDNGPTTIDASISTSGTQEYNGNVTLGDDATLTGSIVTFDYLLDGRHNLTIDGAAVFSGAVGSGMNLTSLLDDGTTKFNVGSVTTTSAQEYVGAVTLDAATTLAGTTVTFDNTVNGANSLGITGGAVFNDIVGGSSPLSSISVSGGTNINTFAITTSGTQDYSGTVTLGLDTNLIAGSTGVTFGGTLNGAHGLTVTGDATFDGIVGSTKLNSILVTGTTNIGTTSISTNGAQTYDGAVTLASGTDLTGSGISFDSTIDGGYGLTITDGGTTIFGGEVGFTTPLTSLNVTANNIDINGGLIDTTSTQIYNGPVTLGATAPTTTALQGSTITFDNTVNGANALNITGSVAFDGIVGAISNLNSLSVTSGTASIDTSAITTTGSQSYGATVLGSNTTLSGDGITFGAISGGKTLTVDDSGTTTFGGTVGTLTSLISNSNTIDLNAGTVTTTAGQTYNGTVILGADTTLNGTAIDFTGTVDSNATARSLTINGSGTLTLGGAIGSTSPLNILTLNVPGVTDSNSIAAADLLLEGTGTFSLSNSSNNVGTIAANITGPLTFKDGGSLTVGTVVGPVTVDGITDTGNNVNLTAPSIALSNDINVGTTAGTVTLDATSGGVSYTAPAGVIANSLVLDGSGTFDLGGADNDINALSGTVTGGNLTYTQTVAGTVTVSSVTDLGQTIIITAPSLVAETVNAGTATGIVDLTASSGSILNDGTGTITGNSVTLDAPNGNIGAPGTFSAGTPDIDPNFISVDLGTTGTVTADATNDIYLDIVSNPFLTSQFNFIGSSINSTGTFVLAVSGGNLTVVSGIPSLDVADAYFMADGNINVDTSLELVPTASVFGLYATGIINLADGSSTTLAAPGGDILVDALLNGSVTGSITTSDTASIDTLDLALAAALGINITTDSTAINPASLEISAKNTVSGGISINNIGDITIFNNSGLAGSVFSDGISNTTTAAHTGNVDITAHSDIDINAPISTGGADLTMTADGSIIMTGAAITTGSPLIGAGNVTLTAGNGTGIGFFYMDGTSSINTTSILNDGSVTINADSSNLSSGDDSILGNIDAGTNFLSLDINSPVGDSVTQQPGTSLIAGQLILHGTSNYDLESPTNAINVLGTIDELGQTFTFFDDVSDLTQDGIITVNILNLTNVYTGGSIDISSEPNLINYLGTIQTGNIFSVRNAQELQETSSSTAAPSKGQIIVGTLNVTNTSGDTILNATDNKVTDIGTINASGVNFVLNNDQNLSETGTISAKGLLLEGNGIFDINNNNNVVSTLAADITGGLAYVNNGALTIGAVDGVDGVTINGTNNEFDLTSGFLTLTDPITNLLGTVTLTTNGATEIGSNGGGYIDANELALIDNGSVLEADYTLNGATPNAVGTLAADLKGFLDFNNGTTALIIGSVSDSVVTTPVNGITTNGFVANGYDVDLISGLLTLDDNIEAGNAIVTLTAQGALENGGVIDADDLGLLDNHSTGEADFILNGVNDVNTIAAYIQGALEYNNGTTALTVGSVSDPNFTLVSELATTDPSPGFDISLVSGFLTITTDINSGLGSNSIVTLDTLGANETTGIVESDNLSLIDATSANFTLTNTNDVGTLAADIHGTLNFNNGTNALVIGSIFTLDIPLLSTLTTGITTNNNNVTLNSGALTLDDDIDAGNNSGNVVTDITAAGAKSNTATAGVISDQLLLNGTGTFSLTGTDNAVGTLAANITGPLTFTQTGALIVGTVDTVAGIKTNNNNVTLNTGALILDNDIDAGSNSGNVVTDITSTDGVSNGTASAGVISDQLLLNDSGDSSVFSLTGTDNAVGVLAADLTGTNSPLTFTQITGPVTVGTVDSVAGITATSLDLTDDTGTSPGITLDDNVNTNTASGGFQEYNGNVTLETSPTLTGNTITFADTVNSKNGTQGLTINDYGTTTFDGTVGNSEALANLLLEGVQTNSNTVIDTGVINTVTTSGGFQTYDNPVTLDSSTTLTGNTITFNSGAPINSNTGAQGLTIDDYGTTTFDANVGTGVPSGHSLAYLTLDGTQTNSKTVINTGTIDTVTNVGGTQTYDNPVTLDVSTNLTGNGITFNDTVDSSGTGSTSANNTLTINDDGATTFNAVVGGTYALGSLLIDGTTLTTDGTTDLNGGTVTTSGTQTYDNPVTLSTNDTLNGVGITFNDTVDSSGTGVTSADHTLTINDNGATTFEATVGGTYALGSLLIDGTTLTTDGTTDLNGGAVTTSGTQTYDNPVTLSVNDTLNGVGITFNDTVDSSGTGHTSAHHTLKINDNGATTFNAVVGGTYALGSLLIDGTTLTTDGTTDLNGGTVTTSGTQTYDNPVTLSTNDTLNGVGITFNDTVDSSGTGVTSADHTLTINDNGATTFEATVGGTYALGTLLIKGTTTASTGTTDLNGGSVTTSGTQTYDNPVTLSVDDTLTGVGITFNDTVNSSGIGHTSAGNSLTINDNGETLFNTNAVVGGTYALGSLLIDGTTLTTDGTTDLNGGTVTTSGTQTYDNPVTLSVDDTLNGVGITFNDTVDSSGTGHTSADHTLTIKDNGATAFNAAVGGTYALGSLLTEGTTTTSTGTTDINGGSVTTSGAQTYDNPVTLSVDDTLTGDDITFNDTVDSSGTGITSADNTLLISDNGATTFNAAVGSNYALGSLTVKGTTTSTRGTTDLNGATVTTSGAQTYDNPVTLSVDDTLNGVGITFNDTVDSSGTGHTSADHTLTINDNGETLFNTDAVVGGTYALGSLLIDGTTLTTYGTTDLNGGTVTTSGAQTYDNPVTLSVDTTLNGVGITFNDTVDSSGTGHTSADHTLTIKDNGATAFNAAVGGTYALGSLLTEGTTTTSTGTTDINGGSVTTSGAQTYDNPVTLSVDDTLTGDDITFNDTVDSSGTGITSADNTLLISDNGATTFNAAVGSNYALGSLTVKGTTTSTRGTTDLNGATVTTSGAQTYDNPVTLSADTTLNGDGITFNDTLNSRGIHTTSFDRTLTINDNGETTFNAAVGGTYALGSLLIEGTTTTSTGTTDINGGSVTTRNAQTYDNPVTLSVDDTLTGDGITFNDTVDSSDVSSPIPSDYNTLTIDDSGITTFEDNVGVNAALGELTVTASSIDLNGGTVDTAVGNGANGEQNYNSPVVLTTDVSLNTIGITSGDGITFVSTVDSDSLATPRSLTINDSGTTTFGNIVGGNDPLNNLIVNANSIADLKYNISANTITLDPTSGGVDQTGGILTSNGLLLQGAGAGAFILDDANTDVTIGANINGSLSYTDVGNLIITAGGITTNNNPVSLTTPDGTLTITHQIDAGTSTITLDSEGGITQPNGILTAGGLLVLSTGAVTPVTDTLDNVAGSGSNDIGTIAANINGALTFSNSGPLTVGTVLGTIGVTTTGDFDLLNNGTLTIANNITSTTGAVNLLIATGNIDADLGTTVTANANSIFQTPNGTMGVVAGPLNVDIIGQLSLDIGARLHLTSGILTGIVSDLLTKDLPVFIPSSYPQPLIPPGNVYFNGVRIWPTQEEFILSQEAAYIFSQEASSLLSNFQFPSAQQLSLTQVNTFDPSTSGNQSSGNGLFLYHPLEDVDSGAFDTEFQLDEGAYDYIDGEILKKNHP